MSDAGDLRESLVAMLSEFGRAVSIERVTPGAYDPSTGDTSAASTVTYNGLGRVGTYSDFLINNELITQNDRKVTFVPDDPTFVPVINDRLIADATYSVMSVKPRELGGEWISFTLQVRR